ncbi:hypothetical protein SAMN06272721_11746 [Arthrobacter sp. P2b]|nr:hypothetical protein SAMN06272721_11746 [Arthrobacter sp. P2b]
MVNNGGGMIIYGMAEAGSMADHIESVTEWDESIEQRLRSWAYSLIQPPVHGLEFTLVAGEDAGQSRAVILNIPASPDTPHFVMQRGSIRAPRRYGSHTVDMNERDIEQAYRRRFEDRRTADVSLAQLMERTVLGIPRSSVWLVAAAQPTRPRPGYAGRIPRDIAQNILASLMSSNPFLVDRTGMENVGLNPRPGYRKWRSTEPSRGEIRGIVDVHDDGSVSLAVKAVEARDQTWNAATDVHVMDAQTLPAYLLQLIRAAADGLSVVGDFQVSISMVSPIAGHPIFIRTFDQGGHLHDRNDLAPIYDFQPVTALVESAGSEADALEIVRGLALDIMNQGGSSALGSVYLKGKV